MEEINEVKELTENEILKEMAELAKSISALNDDILSDFEFLISNGYLKEEAEKRGWEIVKGLTNVKKEVSLLITSVEHKDTLKIINTGRRTYGDCYLLYNDVKQIENSFAFPGVAVKEEYETVIHKFKSLLYACLCYMDFQKEFEKIEQLKEKLNSIYKQSESLFGDISDVETACWNNDEEYSQGSIAFLMAEIGDYATWISEILEDGESREYLNKYYDGMKEDVVNAGILLEDISYCCFDRNDIDIYPKIKNKLNILEENINKLEKGD